MLLNMIIKEIFAKVKIYRLERFEDAIYITSACEGLQDFERGFRLSAAFIHAIQNE